MVEMKPATEEALNNVQGLHRAFAMGEDFGLGKWRDSPTWPILLAPARFINHNDTPSSSLSPPTTPIHGLQIS